MNETLKHIAGHLTYMDIQDMTQAEKQIARELQQRGYLVKNKKEHETVYELPN